jgi:hypothetical protein
MWKSCRVGSIGCALLEYSLVEFFPFLEYSLVEIFPFLEYSLVDFFPVHRNLDRSFDPDTHLITF